MASTTELQDIMATLDRLQSRVRDLALAAPAEDGERLQAAVPSPAQLPPADCPAVEPEGGLLSEIRAGIAVLTALSQVKEVPEFFADFARRHGLRMLLLKRWTSGLQVFMEVNVTLPPEARKKRPDGRAPVPSAKGDIFEAVAEEAGVYAGPVPAMHFPLDLTLMLGRGSRERRIVILPLPTQNHWNTFLYLDADRQAEPALEAAEILSHLALARMCMLVQGFRHRQGRLESILREETAHRLSAGPAAPLGEGLPPAPAPAVAAAPPAPAFRAPQPPVPGPAPTVQRDASADLDPFAASDKLVTAIASATAPAAAPRPAPTHAAPAAPAGEGQPSLRQPLTPQGLLHHSGELPALPKAACHIMAVIEDPRTTATRLEKALAMDQALTAKVLRIANSPFYGAMREIKTVSEAIVRLGFVAIRNWTLVTAARSVFLAPGAGMLYRKIWQQSVMSAMAGQLVAQVAGRSDPENVFIGGLMQNIGQLVLARSHPEVFQEILLESINARQPYHEVERRLLGFDHGELGALLIRDWNLSQDLEDAVYWHHKFLSPDARNARVAAMIALGEEIASCSGGQDPAAEGQDAAPPAEAELPQEPVLSEAASFLGIGAGQIAALRRQAAKLHIDPHFFN